MGLTHNLRERSAFLSNLPWPLAQALRRACNDKTAQGRHNAAYYFFEASLKLSACAQIGSYLALGCADPKLNEELKVLAKASAGSWLQVLNLFSAFLAQRSDAALVPLASVCRRLSDPATLPAGRAFLDRFEKAPSKGKTTVMDVFGAFVAHRNDEMGHGAQRDSEFYETTAPLILDAAIEAIEHLRPFGELKLALSRDVVIERTGESARRFMLLEGDGLQTWMDASADDATHPAGRLWLVGGASRVPLHPLVIYESGEIDRIGFLNKVVGRPKGEGVVVKRCEYLDYYSGERLQSRDAATELALLFSRVYQTKVSTEEIERLSFEPGADTAQVSSSPRQVTIGDFEILGELGRGGMGIVYKARQLTLGRSVALKVLPPALAGDPIAVARFKREIKALGLCDHPNVVKVLTAGQDGDRHFYAMEYVDGCDLSALYDVLSAWSRSSGNLREGHITEAISSAGKLSQARKQISDSGKGLSEEQVREKLAHEIPSVPLLSEGRAAYERLAELMAEAADGLQHLHDRGIIHRDLKPGNLMLTADGRRIVLMDFGLAQLENASQSLTRSADMIVGTLRYMAPEQADVQLRGELVGERSDIYSFGATLYELATLKPIFESASQVQLLEQVQRKEPAAPRKANPSLPKDLETIIVKATQKDRELRYGKAGPSTEVGTVGADLKHFSRGEPISARPPSKFHYLKLFYRRNRALANTVTAAAVIIILATAGFIYTLEQRRLEAESARDAQALAEMQANRDREAAELAKGDAMRAKQVAEENERRAERSANEKAQALLISNRNLARVHIEKRRAALANRQHKAALLHLAAAVELDPNCSSVDPQHVLAELALPLWSSNIAFEGLGDSRNVAVLDATARFLASGDYIWDLHGGERVCEFQRIAQTERLAYDMVALCPGGEKLLAWDTVSNALHLWHVPARKRLHSMSDIRPRAMALAPDGKSFAAATGPRAASNPPQSDDGVVWIRFWDSESGEEIRQPLAYPGRRAVAWMALTADNSRVVVATGREICVLDANAAAGPLNDQPSGVVWSAKKSRDWSLPSGASSIAADESGRYVADTDGRNIYLWNTFENLEATRFQCPSEVSALSVSKFGSYLLAACEGCVIVWETVTGREVRRFTGPLSPVVTVGLSDDASCVVAVVGSFGGDAVIESGVWMWRLDNGAALERRGHGHSSVVTGLAFTPDGQHVLSAGADGTLRMWQTASGEEVAVWRDARSSIGCMDVTPDGRYALAGCRDGAVYVWDIPQRRHVTKLQWHSSPVRCIAVSADGSQFVTGDSGGTLLLWRVAEFTENPYAIRRGSSGESVATACFFSVPTSTRGPNRQDVAFAVSGGQRRQRVCYFNMFTREIEESSYFGVTGDAVSCLASAPGGPIVLAATGECVALEPYAQSSPEVRISSDERLVQLVGFSRNGRVVVCGGSRWDNRGEGASVLGRWVAGEGEDGSFGIGKSLEDVPKVVTALSISSDGSMIACGAQDGRVVLWPGGTSKASQTLEADGWDAPFVQPLPDGKTVLVLGRTLKRGSLWPTSDDTYEFRLIDLNAHQIVNTWPATGLEIPRAMTVSADGTRVAVADAAWRCHVWRTGGELTTRIDCYPIARGRVASGLPEWPKIQGIAFHPDGKALLVAGPRCVQMFNLADGSVAGGITESSAGWAPWDEDSSPIEACSLSVNPALDEFAFGDSNGVIHIRRLSSGASLRTLNGPNKQVEVVRYSSDGRYLASAWSEGTVHLWKSSESTPLAKWHHESRVCALICMPDGDGVVTVHDDLCLRIWRSGKAMLTSKRHEDATSPLGYSKTTVLERLPDGHIVSGGFGCPMQVWTAKDLSMLDIFGGAVGGIGWTVLACPDPNFLLTAGLGSGDLFVWDLRSRRVIRRVEAHRSGQVADSVSAMRRSPDGRIAVSIGSDGYAIAWDLATFKELCRVKALWSDDAIVGDRHFAIVSDRKQPNASVYEVATGQLCLVIPNRPSIRTLIFDGASTMYVARLDDESTGTVEKWSLTSRSRVESYHHKAGQLLAVSYSGTMVAFADWEAERYVVAIHGLGSKSSFRKLLPKDTEVPLADLNAAAFVRGDTLFLTASKDNEICLWNIESGRLLWKNQPGDDSAIHNVFGVDISSSDDMVFIPRCNGTVELHRIGHLRSSGWRSPNTRLYSALLGKRLNDHLEVEDTQVLATGRPSSIWGKAPETLFSAPAWLKIEQALEPEIVRQLIAIRTARRHCADLQLEQSLDDWRDSFEGYRYREERNADGTVRRVPVPPRKQDEFGRYIGEPEGYIDYARWWQETQAPQFK